MDRIDVSGGPQYGQRLNVHEDPDLRAFMDAGDWPARASLLTSRQKDAEPTLSRQGDYASGVAPLRFAKVSSEAETIEAGNPLILVPEPPPSGRSYTRPVRIDTQKRWRRRGGYEQARGQWFRRHGEWQVSLRESPWGWLSYLRCYVLRGHDGAAIEPFAPIGALNEPKRNRQHDDADYVLVDVGADGEGAYVPELLFVPEIKAAKTLATKMAWRDLHPLIRQAHAPPSSFRWLRVYPWSELVAAAASAAPRFPIEIHL
jgi:hypothetical protein